jgi:phospholipid/cholesterol/gamma-HCH transport system substrate-binding protein
VNDQKLYNNLEDTSKNLNKLVDDLEKHPGRYVRFSVFGGKDKKSKEEEEK